MLFNQGLIYLFVYYITSLRKYITLELEKVMQISGFAEYVRRESGTERS